MEPSRLLDWRGRTAVVLASGPSLSDDQIAAVRAAPVKTITTNTTFRRAPWADVFFSVDFLWWKVYHVETGRANAAARWTQDRTSAERFGINWVRNAARDGLGHNAIQSNGNSGSAAINLAYLFGARRILLVGFDMKPAADGRRHWHAEHPTPLVQRSQFKEWLHKMLKVADDLKAVGVEVVNVTPGSAATMFKAGDLIEELAKC